MPVPWMSLLRNPLCLVMPVLLFVTVFLCLSLSWWQQRLDGNLNVLHLNPLLSLSENKSSSYWKSNCLFHTCFEINDCPYRTKDQIPVYVYPEYNYVPVDGGAIFGAELSAEYREILQTIQSSNYYESSPSKACVFIPSVDTLNQQSRNTMVTSQMLQSMPW